MIEEEIFQEEIEDSVGCTFHLKDFEGPLDTLLFLIGKSKMSIEEVKLADITSQYLEYMKEIDTIDLSKASEFIVMASKLIEIKSKSLLPKPREEEPDAVDEEAEIKQRLAEYKLYKEASEKLKKYETVGIMYRAPDDTVGKPRLVLKDMNMQGLTEALKKMFLKLEQRAVEVKERHIVKDRFTVAEKISTIKDTLLLKKRVLFTELFDDAYTKSEIITTFQALLELIKLQYVTAEQKETFGDIILNKVEEDED